jgi:predicted phage-related endonuclease
MKRTGREQWLKARESGIGGSEIGAVLGISKWSSPFSLAVKKLGLVEEEEDRRSAKLDWGLRHESTIAVWYAEATGRPLLFGSRLAAIMDLAATGELDGMLGATVPWEWGGQTFLPITLEETALIKGIESRCIIESYGDHFLLRHREHTWMIGSPDAFAYDVDLGEWGVIDWKCTDHRFKEDWIPDPPPYYVAQNNQYAFMCGLPWIGFGVLFGFWDAGWVDRSADEELIAAIIERGGEFWRALLENVIPDPDSGADETRETIKALFPRPKEMEEGEEPIALPDDAVEWDDNYMEAKAREKEAAKEAARWENKIRHALGDAAEGLIHNGVTWWSKWVEPSGNRGGYRRYYRRAPKAVKR